VGEEDNPASVVRPRLVASRVSLSPVEFLLQGPCRLTYFAQDTGLRIQHMPLTGSGALADGAPSQLFAYAET